MALDKNLFTVWVEGQQFTARDYVYERDLIIDYINENTITQDEVLTGLFDTRYFTEDELDPEASQGSNVLDLRYYTITELLTNGVLDARYYTETELNGLFTTERNRISTLESKFDVTVLAENDQLFDQAVNTDSNVQFNQVTTPTAIVNGVNVGTTLANKTDIGHSHVVTDITDLEDNFYTETEIDAALALKIDVSEKGVANGVATLDGDGRLPTSQLPISTVVFRGTFGSINSTTGGDLPSNGTLEIGDFYICDTDAYASVTAGITFDNGDKAIWTGTAWSKIDNTETVTGVKGDEELEYRVGEVSLGYADVGAAPLVHEHDWTDLTTGVPTTVAGYGITDAYTSTELDAGQLDNRYYTENELINGGVLDGRYYTETELTNGQLDTRYYTETELDAGQLDNRYYTETELDPLTAQGSNVLDVRYYTNSELLNGVLDDRYYTETELDAGQLDNRYYTETEVNDALALKLNTSLKGAPNGLAELGSDGKVPAGQLPSYVDDVLEYADLATFPVTGETGKIYVALDTLKTYRWSGSAYVEIAANEVNSVNGYTGVVALDSADIPVDASGFNKILNTDDTDVQLALAELDQHTHLETDITNLDKYTQAQVDQFLAEKANVADLSASITLFPTTSPSEVSGYFTMVTDIEDIRYNDVAFDVGTGAISTQNQLVASLATDPNIFTGNPGVVSITTLGNIRKTAGNSAQYAEFYYQIFKRDAAGTETLLGTSDTTGAVNPENGNYREFSASAILNNGTFITTDRIVIKYYANALEGTVAEYDFQFGGATPVRTLLPVPVRVLQSAEKIVYDPTNASIVATNLQDAVDELDTLIAQNTSVIQVQRFVINNADNGNGTFTYTYNGGDPINGTLAGGVYTFDLQNGVEYIVGQNRVEVKVNNDITYYAPDAEMTEVDVNTIAITHPFQANDEIFFKVYQGLDSVALAVPDASITTAKLSLGLQADLSSYDSHLAITDGNPHGVDKVDLGLENVTNDAQVKKATSSTDGNIPAWDGTTGDALTDGYGVQTTLSSSTTDLVRADAIQTAVDTINSAIAAKQDTLVSGVNIKTLNGSTILGSGDYVIDIPSVDIAETAPSNPNEGDLWWDSTSAVLYIYYNDGVSAQWVSVSYADVDAAINNLIANAPDALDTLNELAAALGDDPNFATTIASDIAAKANQTDLDTLETTVGTKADKLASFVTLSANHTLEATDAHKVLDFTNSAAVTITVPTNATIPFAVGTQIAVLRNGTGTVTFAGAVGVTVNSVDAKLAIKGQYGSAVVLKTGTDEWQLIGSLE